jgi:hypothetical protein
MTLLKTFYHIRCENNFVPSFPHMINLYFALLIKFPFKSIFSLKSMKKHYKTNYLLLTKFFHQNLYNVNAFPKSNFQYPIKMYLHSTASCLTDGATGLCVSVHALHHYFKHSTVILYKSVSKIVIV